MIIHASIPSSNPQASAQLISKIIDGHATPFPPIPGSWVAVPLDGSGNTIEIYPLGTVATPGPNEVKLIQSLNKSMASAHHLAIATKMSKEEILQLANKEGIKAMVCERAGIFEVVEVWIENQLLIEVITEPQLKRYQDFWSQRADQIKIQMGNK